MGFYFLIGLIFSFIICIILTFIYCIFRNIKHPIKTFKREFDLYQDHSEYKLNYYLDLLSCIAITGVLTRVIILGIILIVYTFYLMGYNIVAYF